MPTVKLPKMPTGDPQDWTSEQLEQAIIDVSNVRTEVVEELRAHALKLRAELDRRVEASPALTGIEAYREKMAD